MKINEKYQLLYKVITGSTAYGTNTPESDTDIKGIYIQDPLEILCGKYEPQIDLSKDEVYYEVGRFLELLSEKSNPTMLEMLFVPEEMVLYKHPLMDLILQNKKEFITKKCKDSFGGMAVAQIKKAQGTDKMMNWEQQRVQRKTVLDFCYISIPTQSGTISAEQFCGIFGITQSQIGLAGLPNMHDCYEMFIDHYNIFATGIVGEGDHESNEVRMCSIPKGIVSSGVLYFNKDGYSMHCKEYRKYQEWIEKRNEARFVDTVQHGQKIDCYLDSVTEYLTDSGWKKYDDICNEDKVASLNSDGQLVFDFFIDRFKQKYSGEIYTHHTKYSKFSVTPNHNLLLKYISRNKNNNFSTSTIINTIKDFEYITVKNYFLKRKNYARILQKPLINTQLDYKISDDEIKLLGAYISDGHISANRINIDQLIGRPLDQIICKKSYISTIKYGDEGQYVRYKYKNDFLIEFINKFINHGSLNKVLSGDIFKFSTRQILLLLEFMMYGDGTSKNCGSKVYYTSSYLLADSLQLLLFIHGINSQIYTINHKGGYVNSTNIKYQVFITKENTTSCIFTKNSSWEIKTVNDEYVTCFTTKYNNIITKNDNKIAIQGNSKNMMHCRRLLEMGIEIAKGEGVNVKRPNREYLLSIRKGEVSLENLIVQSEVDLQYMDELFRISDLPEKCDFQMKDELLKKIRTDQVEDMFLGIKI